MKSSKDSRRAIELLAPLFLALKVKRVEGGYLIGVKSAPEPPVTRSTVKALAFMADLAKRLGHDRDVTRALVRWTGTVPGGVSAWEQEALEWLREDVG